ncbi:MAG: endosulfine family protein [Saprospiraceae bacterium]|nr:endosulfine family protein [Saprospiraceae bacterium]
MTREQYKELAEILHLFENTAPDHIEQLDQQRWRPFLASLATDKDRAFALAAYFDQADYSLSRLVVQLGQMERSELEALRPELEALAALKEQFEARA